MLKLLTCLLTIAMAQELPFWKSKEKVYSRVENGEVIVSVKEVKLPAGQAGKKLKVEGGGQVAAPRASVFKIAQRYENLPRFSDYIKTAKFDPATSVLKLHVAGFGYATDMDVHVKPSQSEAASSLEYLVRTGPMQGLTGRVTMTDLPRSKTEVGLDGEFKYTQFPLPQLFLEFGLELAFRRLAWRLRTFAEQESRPQ
jgi:hypothetical protein